MAQGVKQSLAALIIEPLKGSCLNLILLQSAVGQKGLEIASHPFQLAQVFGERKK